MSSAVCLVGLVVFGAGLWMLHPALTLLFAGGIVTWLGVYQHLTRKKVEK